MLQITEGIVLRVVPYTNSRIIVTIYTMDFGRVSFIVRPSRRKGSFPKSYFMPLTVLSMVIDYREKRDLQYIKECRLVLSQQSIQMFPIKTSIAFFLAEVLYKILQESSADKLLYNYIQQSVILLEEVDNGIANYLLVFLLGLLQPLGLYPSIGKSNAQSYFDLQSGDFVENASSLPYTLSLEHSRLLIKLMRINFNNMTLFSFSRQERIEILNSLLLYYRLHLPGMTELKSLEIVQQLFD